MLFLIMQQFCVGGGRRRSLLTIWSATPAVMPPAILNAAGKLRRPAPRAAFTTMTTAPSDDTPAGLLVSASRCRSVSTLGLCRSHALSPELMLPAPAQSSTSLWIAIETGGEGTGMNWEWRSRRRWNIFSSTTGGIQWRSLSWNTGAACRQRSYSIQEWQKQLHDIGTTQIYVFKGLN